MGGVPPSVLKEKLDAKIALLFEDDCSFKLYEQFYHTYNKISKREAKRKWYLTEKSYWEVKQWKDNGFSTFVNAKRNEKMLGFDLGPLSLQEINKEDPDALWKVISTDQKMITFDDFFNFCKLSPTNRNKKLQKGSAATAITTRLALERARILTLFSKNVNKDGVLDKAGLYQAVTQAFRTTTAPTNQKNLRAFTQEILKAADKDGDGILTEEDWMELYPKMLEHPELPEQMRPPKGLIQNGDLVMLSKQYMAILVGIARNALYLKDKKQFLKSAACRYMMWLQLKSKHKSSSLWIPRDIHFMFVCHMVHPISYNNVCTQLFGKLMSPESLGSFNAHVSSTTKKWKAAFSDDIMKMGRKDH
jgi:hypothetical protein